MAHSTILTENTISDKKVCEIPTSSRGRALHTVDWFLNGKPVLRNHDNPQLTIKDGCHY